MCIAGYSIKFGFWFAASKRNNDLGVEREEAAANNDVAVESEDESDDE